MRKFLSLLVLPFLGGAAIAADLPVKAPVFVPIIAPILGGFYLGAFGGMGMSNERFEFVTIPGSGNLHPSGSQAGAKVGVTQWMGSIMLGIEADAAYDFGRGQSTPCVLDTTSCTTKGSWIFTQRVLVGLVPGTGLRALSGRSADQWPVPLSLPRRLAESAVVPYVTAGVAERRIAVEVERLGSAQQWLVGWTAGGGLRVPVASGISLDVSYLYVNYNKNFVPSGAALGVFPANFHATSEHLGRVGATFGW